MQAMAKNIIPEEIHTLENNETWYFVAIIKESDSHINYRNPIFRVKYFLKIDFPDIGKISQFIDLKDSSKLWNPDTELLKDMTECNVELLYSLSSMVIKSKDNKAVVYKFSMNDPNLDEKYFEIFINELNNTNRGELLKRRVF